MDGKAEWAIANLKSPCVEAKYLTDLNGIYWPGEEQFQNDLAAFLSKRAKPCVDDKVNRYGFELFLQSQKLGRDLRKLNSRTLDPLH